MRILLFSGLIFLHVALYAQTGGRDAVISGNIPALAGKTVEIKNACHFSREIHVNGKGIFRAQLPVTEGYYRFDGNVIYLARGMDLVITRHDSTDHFAGKGSIENELISKITLLLKTWLPFSDGELAEQVRYMAIDSFIARLNGYRSASLALLNTHPASSYFKKTQVEEIDYAVRHCANWYSLYYGVDPRKQELAFQALMSGKPEELSTYYAKETAARIKSLSWKERNRMDSIAWKGFDINNADLFQFSDEYRQLFDIKIEELCQLEARHRHAPDIQLDLTALLHDQDKMREMRLERERIKRDVIKHEISNDLIRENLLHENARELMQPGGNIDTDFNDYLITAKDTAYVSDVKRIYAAIKRCAPGSPAPDFAYKNVNNEQITLNSLKGHYVYIDVWATWCGPCAEELPHLKEVEDKYRGKNIRFVGISMDKQDDKDKWKAFVVAHFLKGTQLISDHDFRSAFATNFNITSIPRFILIDPRGKIVSPDAERPSSPKLQLLLDQLLAKN